MQRSAQRQLRRLGGRGDLHDALDLERPDADHRLPVFSAKRDLRQRPEPPPTATTASPCARSARCGSPPARRDRHVDPAVGLRAVGRAAARSSGRGATSPRATPPPSRRPGRRYDRRAARPPAARRPPRRPRAPRRRVARADDGDAGARIAQRTTMLTSLPGTTISLTTSCPSTCARTFGARAPAPSARRAARPPAPRRGRGPCR